MNTSQLEIIIPAITACIVAVTGLVMAVIKLRNNVVIPVQTPTKPSVISALKWIYGPAKKP